MITSVKLVYLFIFEVSFSKIRSRCMNALNILSIDELVGVGHCHIMSIWELVPIKPQDGHTMFVVMTNLETRSLFASIGGSDSIGVEKIFCSMLDSYLFCAPQ